MSELISGKEALIALANGEDVQYISAGMKDSDYWSDSEKTKNFTIHDFHSSSWVFRLKPRTIKINGVEVPAPFEPREGESYFILNPYCDCGYSEERFTIEYAAVFGAWKTEEEIKQVVNALRRIFK